MTNNQTDKLVTREEIAEMRKTGEQVYTQPVCCCMERTLSHYVVRLCNALDAATEQRAFAEGVRVALRTADALAEALNEEIEKCCRDVRDDCKRGVEVKQSSVGIGRWDHWRATSTGTVCWRCKAEPIRERVYQEGLGEGKP